jgi:hypothetical protein
MKSLLCLLILLSAHSAVRADEKSRLLELDAYWKEVSRAVTEGDFDGYKVTCHVDGVLVSGSKKTCTPLAVALERWKPEFVNTKSGKMKASVEFRFSRRLGDETTAHETGMFLYSSTDSEGKTTAAYIHMEALLLKRDGQWKIMMEYQKSEASKMEWEALAL